MKTDELKALVLDILQQTQTLNILSLDVSELTAITDFVIIGSARTGRHAKSIAKRLLKDVKPFHMVRCESDVDNTWVLLDMDSVVVHIMLPHIRELYNLEELFVV